MAKKILLFFMFALLFTYIEWSLLTVFTLLAAIAHELGHIIALRACGIRVQGLRLLSVGADIRTHGRLLSYKKSMVISLSGVITNFLLFILFSQIAEQGTLAYYFALCNLTLGIFNLFPIQSLDGGEAFSSLLYMLLPVNAAHRTGQLVGHAALILLWSLSVYLLIWSTMRFSLFLICVYLFTTIIWKHK